jgi:hypothetical protein
MMQLPPSEARANRGPATWVVLYREKDYPRGARHPWHHSRLFTSEEAAEQERARLRRHGFHAIVERKGGGRSTGEVPLNEAEREAEEADEQRRLRSNRRG